MNAWQIESRAWLTAGWTMLHFLWVAGLWWLVAVVVRRAAAGCAPQVRYGWSLACLAALPALAAGLAVRIGAHGGLIDAGSRGAAALNAEAPESNARDGVPGVANETTRALAALSAEGAAVLTVSDGDAWAGYLVPAVTRTVSVLPWLWFLGTPLVTLLFGAGVVGTVRLRIGSRPVADRGVLDALARLQSSLRIGQRVLLAVTDKVTSPLVIGIVRPVILLPPSLLAGLAPDQLEMILLHELAHIRRWDNLVNLLQRVIESLLFYHPAVWWASRWARLEREHCCDAVVLAHGRDPQAYAETLASLALPDLAPRYAAAAMANHQLVSRIRHILNVEERNMSLSVRTVAWSAVIVVFGVAVCLLGIDLARGRTAVADEPARPDSLQQDAQDSAIKAAVRFLSAQQSQHGEAVGEGAVLSDIDSDGLVDVYLSGLKVKHGDPAAWSPQQATGAPDVPQAGDDPRAWASLTPDGQQEWLELTFAEDVQAAAILVYESYNPGALAEVKVTTEVLDSSLGWRGEVSVWQATDPVRPGKQKGVAVIPVNLAFKIGKVKLILNSPQVAGWNEIDAVGLIDVATGQVHWATSAQASSSFAEWTGLEDYHRKTIGCASCHQNVHGSSDTWQLQRLEHCPGALEAYRELLLRYDRELSAPPAPQALGEPGMPGASPAAGRMTLVPLITGSDMAPPGMTAAPVQDRRQRIASLKDELQRLEQELVREDEVRAVQAAEEIQAQRDRVTVQGFLREHTDDTKSQPSSPPSLHDLHETLRQQQAAIDRLTRVLEALQSKLQGGAAGAGGGSADESTPDSGSAGGAAANPIDRLIELRLREAPEANVDDATFLRRLMLDVTGTVPTAEDVKRFLEDPSPDKRQRAIDELLRRSR